MKVLVELETQEIARLREQLEVEKELLLKARRVPYGAKDLSPMLEKFYVNELVEIDNLMNKLTF